MAENQHDIETSDVNNGGRPTIPVTRDQVLLLQARGFTAKQMAIFFKCSTSLMYSRLKDFGLGQRLKFSTLSDLELDDVVSRLHANYPNAGVKMMSGYLLAEGKKVQRKRLRESLSRVEVESSSNRKKTAIARRQYKVASPNSLWHMDGHMKLIRWGITTHGCIDGFSRLIVFLMASLNNKACTVFQLFLQATIQFGLPSMVRSDHGGENIHVALFVNLVQGINRHITGKSVHNQRIERLWRDVHNQVTGTFYRLFYQLEDDGKLDINNERDVTALQIVYLPEINRRLSTFQCGWNKHGIRTEKNRTPEQLWMEGSLCNAENDTSAMRGIFCSEPSIEQQLEQGLQQYGLTLQQFDGLQVGNEQADAIIPGVADVLAQNLSLEEKFVLVKSVIV